MIMLILLKKYLGTSIRSPRNVRFDKLSSVRLVVLCKAFFSRNLGLILGTFPCTLSFLLILFFYSMVGRNEYNILDVGIQMYYIYSVWITFLRFVLILVGSD